MSFAAQRRNVTFPRGHLHGVSGDPVRRCAASSSQASTGHRKTHYHLWHTYTRIPRCTVMTKHYPCTSCSLSHETSFPSPASSSRPYVHADPIRGARLGPSQAPIVLDRIMSCDTLTDRPKESMTQSMAQLPCTCWPTGTCGSSLGQCGDVCTLHCLFRDTVDGTWGRHAMLHDTHLWPQRGDDPVRCPVHNARAAIPPRALRHGAPYGRTRSQSKRSATTCGMCAVSCDLAKCQHDWTAPCRVTPRLLGVAAHIQRSMRPKTQGKPAGNSATQLDRTVSCDSLADRLEG